jgi:hypothetical protein
MSATRLVGMHSEAIDIAVLRAAVATFGSGAADGAWINLVGVVGTDPDPGVRAHRQALLRWLNAWGCRIRYPGPGDTDLFDTNVGAWWQHWGSALPAPSATLAELDDPTIDALGPAYRELASVIVADRPRVRSLGPTAASKLLHALRPRALMPWDEAIAVKLHGGRTAATYVAHQRLGRTWGRAVLAQAGTDEGALAAGWGTPGRPLAKMLDDYCYLTYTRGTQITAVPS